MELQKNALISSFWPIPARAALNNFYDGTSGQAVLANMRGTGEIILENDFSPGSDLMG